MVVTEFGIVIEDRPVHPRNVLDSIAEMALDIVIEVSPVQFSKAPLPKEVTELGIVIEVSPRQPLKAP